MQDTSADFWQMVWEQGCVVIVMLTRLVENDVVLCHRYWPEEGSELYHIYEVSRISYKIQLKGRMNIVCLNRYVWYVRVPGSLGERTHMVR